MMFILRYGRFRETFSGVGSYHNDVYTHTAQVTPMQDLVERAQRGDADALEVLMRQVHMWAYTYAYRFWRDVEYARDAAQEVCIRVWRALPRYRDRGHFRAWVFRIAYNYVRHQWRYERFRRWFPLLHVRAATRADPETRWMQRQDLQWLIRGLDRLTLRERTALILCVFHDMRYEEIARVMRCSLQQVKNYIFRGRQKLRRWWQEETHHASTVSQVSDAVDGSPRSEATGST